MDRVGGEPVLVNFVRQVPEAGFFDGQPGKRLRLGERRGGHGADNGVHLLLRELREDRLGSSGSAGQRPRLLDGLQILVGGRRSGINHGGSPAKTAGTLAYCPGRNNYATLLSLL